MNPIFKHLAMDSPTPAINNGATTAIDTKSTLSASVSDVSPGINSTSDTQKPSQPLNAAHALRLQCRTNAFTGPTSGLAPGHIQANLLVLPASAAPSFFALCQRNPVPCPLLAYSKPGRPKEFISCLPGIDVKEMLGDFDVRRDAPEYYLYEHGTKVAELPDIVDEFVDEDWGKPETHHVAFLIGCSFSFESRLSAEGLPPKHWSSDNPRNTPMYKTNIPLLPAGVFRNPGTMVVSMRPYLERHVERVRAITGAFRSMHGEPIAWGWDAVKAIGIRDIYDVDFGGPTEVKFEDGEVPVFWGCGVTPQIAVIGAGDAIDGIVIGHKPGHMLLLDLTEERALAVEKKIDV